MLDVQINSIKNRLYITMGDLKSADIAAYVNKIESACRSLASGFTCLTVLNKKGLIRQREKEALCLSTICPGITMGLIYAYGASKIVCVRENNDNSGFFQRNLKDFQTDFTMENAKNIQEAEDILDENKIRQVGMPHKYRLHGYTGGKSERENKEIRN